MQIFGIASLFLSRIEGDRRKSSSGAKEIQRDETVSCKKLNAALRRSRGQCIAYSRLEKGFPFRFLVERYVLVENWNSRKIRPLDLRNSRLLPSLLSSSILFDLPDNRFSFRGLFVAHEEFRADFHCRPARKRISTIRISHLHVCGGVRRSKGK